MRTQRPSTRRSSTDRRGSSARAGGGTCSSTAPRSRSWCSSTRTRCTGGHPSSGCGSPSRRWRSAPPRCWRTGSRPGSRCGWAACRRCRCSPTWRCSPSRCCGPSPPRHLSAVGRGAQDGGGVRHPAERARPACAVAGLLAAGGACLAGPGAGRRLGLADRRPPGGGIPDPLARALRRPQPAGHEPAGGAAGRALRRVDRSPRRAARSLRGRGGAQVAAIVLTHSRSGAVGAAAAAALFLLRGRRKAAQVDLGALLAAGSIAFAPTSFWTRSASITEYETDASVEGRRHAWTVLDAIVDERPLTGVGAGAFLAAGVATRRSRPAAAGTWPTTCCSRRWGSWASPPSSSSACS